MLQNSAYLEVKIWWRFTAYLAVERGGGRLDESRAVAELHGDGHTHKHLLGAEIGVNQHRGLSAILEPHSDEFGSHDLSRRMHLRYEHSHEGGTGMSDTSSLHKCSPNEPVVRAGDE